jgi:hypothetical protein
VPQQIRAVVRAAHFEIVRPGPFGPAFDLIPAVEHFSHLDRLPFPNEPSRCLVGLGPGVTFDFDREESHSGPEAYPIWENKDSLRGLTLERALG